MTCPYCNQQAYDGAKFCAGCGLPLRDDSNSFAGISLEDGGARNWLIAGGVACVALLIAGITMFRPARDDRARPTARGPQGGYVIPPPVPTGMGLNTTTSASAARSATYNPSVQWAFNPVRPPALPAVDLSQLTAPAAPPVLLAVSMPLMHRPAYVASVSRAAPELPTLPDDVQAAADMAEERRAALLGWTINSTGDQAGVPLGDLNGYNVSATGLITQESPGAAAGADPNGRWVWDPVHERWAYRAERLGSGGRVSRSPQPTALSAAP